MTRCVVLLADRNYFPGLAATMNSLAHHWDATAADIVYVMHSGLLEEDRRLLVESSRRFGGAFAIEFIEQAVPHWMSAGRLSPRQIAINLRLEVPRLLADHDHLLYVDSDMIVLSDIGPLFDTDLGDNAVGAVRDAVNPFIETGHALRDYQKGGAQRTPYFNAGLMYIDVPRYLRSEVSERAWAFMEAHPNNLTFQVQDGLNAVLQGQWTRLRDEWNVFVMSPWRTGELPLPDGADADVRPSETHRADLRLWGGREPLLKAVMRKREAAAKVLHYVGSVKPWQPAYPPGERLQTFQRFALGDAPGDPALA